MTDRDTAGRLALHCPRCDRRGTLGAYAYGGQIAVRCNVCDHVWMERPASHAIALRAGYRLSPHGEIASHPIVADENDWWSALRHGDPTLN